MKATVLFTEFFESEKAGGLILLFCATLSLVLANSAFGETYFHFWHLHIASKPLEFWINDALMTVFFLLVGLEIEREIYIGELSDIRKSLLPVIAAGGGMIVPALIHFAFNHNTPTQDGFGIPMATDIAFSIGILSLLGNRVPVSLKIFLTALAIFDDLGAIITIALFYSTGFSILYFGLATLVFVIMFVMNRMKFHHTWVYLIMGCIMWFFMYRSGIHATITGVLLAFVIPFGNGDKESPSYNLQHQLHKPVAWIILPLFSLANTVIIIPPTFAGDLLSHNSMGIFMGLVLGKPIGVFLFAITGIGLGICSLPEGLKKRHVLGAGFLAGIGFTMSIFITLLAFPDTSITNSSKIAVLCASLTAGLTGFFLLYFLLPKRIS